MFPTEIQAVIPAFTDPQSQLTPEQQQFRSDIPQQNITSDVPYMSQSQLTPEQQQFRSDIPQQNITSDVPYMSQQNLPESAPVFQEYTPQSEALTQNLGDGLAASK